MRPSRRPAIPWTCEPMQGLPRNRGRTSRPWGTAWSTADASSSSRWCSTAPASSASARSATWRRFTTPPPAGARRPPRTLPGRPARGLLRHRVPRGHPGRRPPSTPCPGTGSSDSGCGASASTASATRGPPGARPSCSAGPPDGLRLVTCHLGAGASLAAVRDGRSVDTTMGFTPNEGLVMATRSGSVDPGMLLWLIRHAGIAPDALEQAWSTSRGCAGSRAPPATCAR